MHRMNLVALSLVGVAAVSAVAMPPFGDWTAPMSIEALPGSSTQLNTAFVDGCPSISPDGLALYFSSNRTGTLGGVDIWVAHRSSKEEGFGEPVNLGAPINSGVDDVCPTFVRGNRLFFSSRRDEINGDLYVARRVNGVWQEPERLGPNINSSAQDEVASLFEDEDGDEVLYFHSTREGRARIYYSIDLGPAQLAPGGVNSSASDGRPSVSHDGREIFWDSSRSGTLGANDIWTATRSSTDEQWGTAIHLGALSSPAAEVRPSVSWDGRTLVFASTRAGNEGLIDTYIATREKLSGK